MKAEEGLNFAELALETGVNVVKYQIMTPPKVEGRNVESEEDIRANKELCVRVLQMIHEARALLESAGVRVVDQVTPPVFVKHKDLQEISP